MDFPWSRAATEPFVLRRLVAIRCQKAKKMADTHGVCRYITQHGVPPVIGRYGDVAIPIIIRYSIVHNLCDEC